MNLNPTMGHDNTATGFEALFTNTTGKWNTANGSRALHENNGDLNTATGNNALRDNQTGTQNTATGAGALRMNTTGSSNTADGFRALLSNISGDSNTATGVNALHDNTTIQGLSGDENTATGVNALFRNTTGSFNTAMGVNALYNNEGSNNTFVGYRASMVGNENIVLGSCSGFGTCPGKDIENANNVIIIGTGHVGPPSGVDVDKSCLIGNIRGHPVGAGALPVMIDGFDRLGTEGSSRRLKKEIKPMEHASEAILGLKPVTFHYKSDNTNTPRFGLIAEEVAEVNPDLVVCDKNGEIYAVRYDAVNAMLLNEFLKEHRKVEQQDRRLQQQEATIAQLKKELQTTGAQQQKQIEALTAGLQRVSAQLELNKPSRQTVLNNQ